MNDIIVGLDIGTTKIACFVGQKDSATGKVKILGYGRAESVGVERGVVRSVKNTSLTIAKVVNAAADQANVDIDEVYVGIAGQHIKSMQNQGLVMIPSDHRYIEQSDIDRLIEDQHHISLPPGEVIIHVFPQTYYVDGEELSNDLDPVGVPAKELKANFHIVTANEANLLNIRESVRMAGLHIKGVVLEPIASAYAVLDDTDRMAGVALVDIGGGTTDVAIFHEGIIRHTSVLAVAGNVITNDIKEGCKLLKEQAELIKTRFGSCMPQQENENEVVSVPGIRSQPAREVSLKTLAGIIKARTETILEQVRYEITKSGYENQLIAGVVLTGGGAKLKYIKELAEYVTASSARIGIPDEHLVAQTPDEYIHPMYATGIGLVLYGIDEAERLSHKQASIEPEPQPQSEPEPVQVAEEPKTDTTEEKVVDEEKPRKKEKNKGNMFNRLAGYLDNLFRDSVDTPQE
ncbi:MAG: cell division protein FtsA [Bacteroidales bacterium]|nr:cell division protein FtsA [Bacteroidales bacterium]MBQ9639864.1 cell division protein FtsA [Bacteroidales bacterium]